MMQPTPYYGIEYQPSFVILSSSRVGTETDSNTQRKVLDDQTVHRAGQVGKQYMYLECDNGTAVCGKRVPRTEARDKWTRGGHQGQAEGKCLSYNYLLYDQYLLKG